jgi:spermidine/putrescine transport system permease protein
MSPGSTWAWYGFAGLTVTFMVSPLAILVVFCFNESPLLSFPLTGFSLKWIATVFERPQFREALENSLLVTATVGIASTVIGTMTAMGLARLRPGLASIIMSALTVPFMVPPLMLGIVFLSYYTTWLDMDLGIHTVILSHLVFTQPFVILIVHARMANFDFAAIDSALDLGASSFQAFRTVTLPIVRLSIVGAAMIAMALSLDDFLVTFFTIGGSNTLPTLMWGMLRRGVDPSINVVAVIIMLLSVGVTLLGLRITRYRG